VIAVIASEGSSSLPFLIVGVWVLLLSVFVGFIVIQKVPPTLHTPLMSGSNAISGITIVGSLYCVSVEYIEASSVCAVLGCLAIVMAMINVVGGFAVTARMLQMFKAKDAPKSGAKS
jgi:NAD(P) transhydrogenase subunit alpha